MSIGLRVARAGRALLMLLGVMGAGSAYCQTREMAPAVWDCWYDGATSVECRLGAAAPIARPAVAVYADVESARADAEQPRRANDRLPRLVSMLHEEPSAFARRRVSIPLHSHPEDMELVRQLADAVMCGRNRACSIRFAESADQLAMMAPAALAD